jgi:predicted dehydrogenase
MGRADADDFPATKFEDARREAIYTLSRRFADAYKTELDAFVDLACGRAENPCGVEAAEKALRAAIACEISRKENRPVALSRVDS